MRGPESGRGWAERVARALVAAAAPLVPAVRRPAWREEWEAEVWHHVRGRVDAPRASSVGLVLRCLGAIPHALSIRGEQMDVGTIAQDARFAVRTLRRRPLFALVAVCTLALGIGGNTAVFSVVDAVLLRPLPLPNADRLVRVWGREFNGRLTASVSPPDYLDYREGVEGAFERLAAYASFSSGAVYADGERPVELSVRPVSHDLLQALGEDPALGRTFREAETLVSEADVVMISHGVWGRLFGFDPQVLGSTLRLDGTPRTVVGVLPEDLDFPAGTDVWEPLTFGADWYGSRSAHFLRPIGLLAEGVSADEAQGALDLVSARLEAAFPETNEGWYATAQSLRDVFVGSARPALLILLAAIGLVLLIACANVAGLLLARAAGRRGEVAVRTALGASRGRVVRQLLTESVILSVVAGILGIALAWLGVWALVRLEPGNLPRLDEVAIDGPVLIFTAAVSVCVGVLFGLAPALGLTSRDVAGAIRRSGRGASRGSGRLRSVLVVGEVGLSFVLVTGAVLLARSFVELSAVDPGFDPRGVGTLPLAFPEAGREERTVALDAVLERVRAIPGVDDAGAADILPFSGTGGDTYVYAEDRPPENVRNIDNTALIRTVDEGYFRTLGYRLDRGRAFERTDDASVPPRVVINQTLADFLFPDEDPLGKRMAALLDSATALEVIGVIRDARQFSFGANVYREFMLSGRQFPRASTSLLVRGASGRAPPAEAVRAAVWEIDPNQPLSSWRSLEAMVDSTLAPGRFQALLLGLFAGFAVLLAGVGLYGVLAEGVNERRREIGVRMAMGALPSSVVGDVIGRGLRLAGLGIVLGALASLAGTDVLSSLLFGVGPRDPVAFALTPAFLLAVVVIASGLPALKASRVDPVRALREEG